MNHFFHPDNIVLVDNNLHWKAPLRAWILKDIKRKEIIGNSTHYDIINQASGSYDLAIIDGDHTYDGVKADTENYIPFIRDGGFIIYHDSVLDDWGIKQLVNELKTDRRVEFIHEFVSTKRAPLGLALFKKVAA
jgi:cephalosporin hydroxylase